MAKWFSKLTNDPGPDAGYSWVVCVCCFMINHFAGGLRNCQGNIYVILQKNSGLGREVASWPNTCLALSVSISALFSGVLNYYFNWRKVLNGLALLGTLGFLIAYIGSEDIVTTCIAEVIIGLSIGPVFPTLVRITASYFVKRRALAQNISFGANPVSSITFPLILDRVEGIYGLRGSWLVLCSLYIQSFVFVALCRPRDQKHFSVLKNAENRLLVTSGSEPTSNNTKKPLVISQECVNRLNGGDKYEVVKIQNNDEKKERNGSLKLDELQDLKLKPLSVTTSKGGPPPPLSFINYLKELRELLVNPVFLVFLFTVSTDFTLFMSSFFVVIDYGIDLGMTTTEATMLLIALSVGDFCSRLVAGWIIDKQWTSLLRFFSFTCFLSGLVYIFIGFAVSPIWLYVGCFLNGVVYCFTSALRMLMSTNLFEASKGATITGIIVFLLGIFVILLPTLIGVFREQLGSYSYLYLLFGILDISLVPVALLLDRFVQKKA